MQPISDAQLSVVGHSVRPWTRSEYDQGKVDHSFRLEHITMVFKPSESHGLAVDVTASLPYVTGVGVTDSVAVVVVRPRARAQARVPVQAQAVVAAT